MTWETGQNGNSVLVAIDLFGGFLILLNFMALYHKVSPKNLLKVVLADVLTLICKYAKENHTLQKVNMVNIYNIPSFQTQLQCIPSILGKLQW